MHCFDDCGPCMGHSGLQAFRLMKPPANRHGADAESAATAFLALRLQSEAEEFCKSLDARTLTKCIGHLGNVRKPSAVAALLDAFQRAGRELDVIHWNAAISACAKNSSWALALSVFEKMSSPDIISVGAMINAFAKAQRWTEPLKLLDDAIQKKMQANAIVFSSSIAAGAKSGRWQTALSLLLRMGQLEVGANPLTLSSAISCCSSTTEWCQALRCLPCTRRMRACSSDNAATMRGIEGSYNAALGALGADQWLQSLWLFQLMASKRVGDSASLTSVIDSVGKAGWWSAALDLLEVGSQGQSDAIMFSAAINACEKCACWQLALGLLARMGPRSCAACNAAISACSKATAWALMELRRDTISCNSLLNACDKSQQWMLSLHVLETMRTEGIQQDAITFTAVLGACETSDQWAVTMHLLQEVLDGGYCDWQADDIDYVHYFQAGSPYDCLKHMLILHTLTSMVNDASPFLYVDTHAGTGIYDLKSPEAQRFQNHQGGILSLMKVERHAASKALSDYLRLHGIFPRLCRKGSTFEETYLGSPAIAQLFLRPQDAAILFDASPQVASALDRNLQSLSGTSNTEVFCTSSYKWFSKSIKSQYQRYAHLSRVLALIDPPYDSASSSDKWNLFLVKRIRTMWPQSCVLLWYPFVSEGQTKQGLDSRRFVLLWYVSSVRLTLSRETWTVILYTVVVLQRVFLIVIEVWVNWVPCVVSMHLFSSFLTDLNIPPILYPHPAPESEDERKRLDQRLVAMEIGTVLVADLAVSPKNDAPSESRSSMVIVNPPSSFEQLDFLLEDLRRNLERGNSKCQALVSFRRLEKGF
ncbi:unnamed protein product [Durusdinium trenchii]|uniref:Pentatricopeptide repeat-containing protein, chloroplastic n=2 Tax=Durusdinium trenchii TaxID=1381693 RepID=A0ABP0RBK0_9DINO